MSIDFFLDPWLEGYFQRTFFTGILLICMTGPLGCLLFLRGRGELANLIVHSALLGSIVGILVVKKIAAGAHGGAVAVLLSCLTPFLVLWLLRVAKRTTVLDSASFVSCMFISLLGIVLFLLSSFQNLLYMDIPSVFLGNILQCTVDDLWFSGVSTVVVCSLLVLCFRYFHLALIDPVMAASLGVSVCVLDCLVVAATSLSAAGGVSVMGSLVMLTLLVSPQALARLVSTTLWKMMIISILSGCLSLLLGMYISVWLNTTSLGGVIVVSLLQFVLVLFFFPQGIVASWVKTRALVPESMSLNILNVLYDNGNFAQYSFIVKYVIGEERIILIALRGLIREGLVVARTSGYFLTEKGVALGESVNNAGKLWEKYLINMNIAKEDMDEYMRSKHFIYSPEFIDYFSKKMENVEKPDIPKREI